MWNSWVERDKDPTSEGWSRHLAGILARAEAQPKWKTKRHQEKENRMEALILLRTEAPLLEPKPGPCKETWGEPKNHFGLCILELADTLFFTQHKALGVPRGHPLAFPVGQHQGPAPHPVILTPFFSFCL